MMVDPNTYNFYKTFLFDESGYVLSEDKQYLLESKLNPVAKQHGVETVIELADKLNRFPDALLKQSVIEAMTINETFFFRDKAPFEVLEKVVKDIFIREKERSSLRFWSAACSSGQEPYSIAIIMEEISQKVRRVDYKIIGSDISSDILTRARDGIYNDFEVKRGLEDGQIEKYFDALDSGWKIKELLKRHIEFKKGNLVRDHYTDGPFDVVFLRNVLIYFDVPTKTRVLEKMHRVVSPEGYLVLGAPETVMGLGDFFVPVPELKGFYRPAQ